MSRKTTTEDLIGIDDVILLLEQAIDEAGGQRAWGRKYDISSAYISKVINGRKAPGGKIIDALGLVTEFRWRSTKR